MNKKNTATRFINCWEPRSSGLSSSSGKTVDQPDLKQGAHPAQDSTRTQLAFGMPDNLVSVRLRSRCGR